MSNYKQGLIFCCALLLAYLAAGCAPPMLSEPVVKSRLFKSSYDTTWNAAVKAISASGEFINVAQKDSGLISFQKTVPKNEIKKYALASGWYSWCNVFANISVLINKTEKDECQVTVNTKIFANQGSVYGERVELGSSGLIEREYLDKIAALVPGTKTYDWLESDESQKATEEASDANKASLPPKN